MKRAARTAPRNAPGGAMRRVLGAVCGVASLVLVGCQSTVGPEQIRQADAYGNLGAMHLQRGRPEASIREYLRALKANPRDARALVEFDGSVRTNVVDGATRWVGMPHLREISVVDELAKVAP